MKIYKKCIAESYSFLVNDTTLPSDNPLRFRKYITYITGEEILPSNQKQIFEQAKFTYSPLGKAFEKRTKTIEDQGEKQIGALKDLKLKQQTKPIQGKSNNQPKAPIIFNELINKRKKIMRELYDSSDYNNLKFEYAGPTKDVSFDKYKDSEELFNAIRNNQIKFSVVKNKQNEFLNKLNNTKIGKKTIEQKKSIDNLEKFYISRQEVINFF